jgi:hypothetical protein
MRPRKKRVLRAGQQGPDVEETDVAALEFQLTHSAHDAAAAAAATDLAEDERLLCVFAVCAVRRTGPDGLGER